MPAVQSGPKLEAMIIVPYGSYHVLVTLLRMKERERVTILRVTVPCDFMVFHYLLTASREKCPRFYYTGEIDTV